jgi:hypothetical protein
MQTPWKIQGELRCFERRPFVGKWVGNKGPSLKTSKFSLYFQVVASISIPSFLIGTSCTGRWRFKYSSIVRTSSSVGLTKLKPRKSWWQFALGGIAGESENIYVQLIVLPSSKGCHNSLSQKIATTVCLKRLPQQVSRSHLWFLLDETDCFGNLLT